MRQSFAYLPGMAKTVYWILLLFSLQQCRSKNESGNNTITTGPDNSFRSGAAPTKTNSSFLNGITVKSGGGLVVASAYLTSETGDLLAPQNRVQTGEAVYLNLVIEKGWTAEKGRIVIGASQSILTDKGEPVLSSGDLFSNAKSHPEASGNHLQLKAAITKSRPGIAFYTVQFRIWDKKGNGEAQGSYRLYLAGEEKQ